GAVFVAAKRIAPLAGWILARPAAGLLLELLHHGIGHVLHPLLQLAEGLALRIDGLARLALLQRLGGITHRAFSAAERARDVAHHLAGAAQEIAEVAPPAFLLARPRT